MRAAKYSLFEGMEENDLHALLSSAEEVRLSSGNTVVEEGNPIDGLYLISTGRIEIRKSILGRIEKLGQLKQGDFFGEMAVLGPRKNTTSFVAVEDSILLKFKPEAVERAAKKFPGISWNMAICLSDRLLASGDALKNQIVSQQEVSEKEINRLHSLMEATQTVNSSLELPRVLNLILHEAMRITGAERGTIYLVDEDSREIWSRIFVGNEISEIRQPIGKGISGYVAQTGETVNIQDAYHDARFNPEFDLKSGFKTRNILCMPLKNKDGKIIGVSQLINKKVGDFDSDDEGLLRAFSVHASIAIDNSRIAAEMVKTERLSAVGQMAGTIIHDIKNPMSTIRVYAQVLKKKAGNEEASALVDEIIKQIDRLVNLAQEVLDFSRGVSQLNVQRINFDEFLSGVLWFLQKDFEKRNIELHNENRFMGEVELDADKMTRVILNIAGNAADAMPNGGKFYVRSGSTDGTLTIELEDTGTGMPEDVRKKIFEPFVTYGKVHGTGLGMAIVKKIIDDHKGQITIESEVGKGTKMILKLPISQSD